MLLDKCEGNKYLLYFLSIPGGKKRILHFVLQHILELIKYIL